MPASLLFWAPWIAWADLVFQLGHTWSSSEQYAYGWFVPFVTAVLVYQKWTARPEPAPGDGPWASVMLGGAWVLALALVGIRIVHEVNPGWPLASWVHALVVVLLILFVAHRVGGAGWVRWFAFPAAFILVAVQWPDRLEGWIIRGLMRVVAACAVEILGLLDIPALQRGNLIEIDSGVLGVEEACSGIRSLQTTLMGALLFGELQRLGGVRRFGLIGFGVVCAVVLNVGRTTFLSWSAATQGMSSVDRWHDPAGLTIVVVSFAALWGCAWWMSRRSPVPGDEAGVADGVAISERRGSGATGRVSWAVGGLAMLVAMSPLINEAWYRLRPTAPGVGRSWSFRMPSGHAAFKPIEIPAGAREQLRHDRELCGTWMASGGRTWTVYWLDWNPRKAGHTLRARQHRPELCLTAAGLRLEEDYGIRRIRAGEVDLPFRAYRFSAGGEVLHVFFLLWEDGMDSQTGALGAVQEQLLSAWRGRRFFGQQTLEIVLDGYGTMDEALEAVRAELPQWIEPAPGPVGVGAGAE